MKNYLQQLKTHFNEISQTYTWADFHKEFGYSDLPISQNPAELKMLVEVYKKAQPTNVLEIGQDYGASFYYLLKFRTPNSKIVGLDANHERIKRTFRTWDVNRHDTYLIEGNSGPTFPKTLEVCPYFDFVFIDGGHEYHIVAEDFTNSVNSMKSGIICLHDIHLGLESPGVPQLWEEIKASGKYFTEEFIYYKEVRNENLGIGVVIKE